MVAKCKCFSLHEIKTIYSSKDDISISVLDVTAETIRMVILKLALHLRFVPASRLLRLPRLRVK